MENINIYIKVGVHPQFKEMVDFPPNGTKYFVDMPRGDHNISKLRNKRRFISRMQRTFPIPRFVYVKNTKKIDIIHSTRGFLVMNKKPWIVDLETAAAFQGLNWKALLNPITQKIITKFLTSKYCKKILPQSHAAKGTVTKYIRSSKKFEDKLEVLYPAYRAMHMKRSKSDKIRLSFIGREFIGKGAHDLLKAFQILDRKYDIELKMKTIVPPGFRLNLPNVKYLESNLPKDQFYQEIFFNSDIFVEPTFIDSFGITILEAMATGLPVVATDDFTIPEIIQGGFNGFLVHCNHYWDQYIPHFKNYGRDLTKHHPELIKDLVEKLSILIEDDSLRRKMGRRNYKIVKEGKFSIKERNKKLYRIYRECLE